MSLRTELAVRTESFMGIGDGQGSKQLKLAPKTLKVRICVPYGLEGYSNKVQRRSHPIVPHAFAAIYRQLRYLGF